MLTSPQQEISAFIYSLLAQKDYPEQKIREKIQKKFPNTHASEIEESLNRFQEKGLIDDLRFAQQYIRYKKENAPRGIILLSQELKKKGIEEYIITQALEEELSKTDEDEMCKNLMLHKWGTYSPLLENNKKKEKLFRFLLSKGFSFSLISSVFQRMIEFEDGFLS